MPCSADSGSGAKPLSVRVFLFDNVNVPVRDAACCVKQTFHANQAVINK